MDQEEAADQELNPGWSRKALLDGSGRGRGAGTEPWMEQGDSSRWIRKRPRIRN
jgi:hypothetical protein